MSLTPLTPEEKRRRRLREKKNAVRTVRNTLLAIAVLAGLWYLYLTCKDSRQMVPVENIDVPVLQDNQTQSHQQEATTSLPAEQ